MRNRKKMSSFVYKVALSSVFLYGGISTCDARTEPVEKTAKNPNILFYLIDDEGWKDPGCFGGHFIDTPQANLLAEQGMKFTQAYASPVCSPTRASLVTGQNPARHGVWEVIGVVDRPYAKMKSPAMNDDFNSETKTYADMLTQRGYACGIVGKWHAGGQPWQHGFEKIEMDDLDADLTQMTQGTDYGESHAITARSLQFIRDNHEQPFMLCVSHHLVHAPLDGDPTLTQKYIDKLRMTGITDVHPVYAAMAEQADQSLGLLLGELKKYGLEENTIIVYYSDNGGMIGDMYLKGPTALATNLRPLRGQKGSLYEGGIRVPLIVKWPGVVQPATQSDEVVCSYDLYPTFIDMAGANRPANQVTDGLSLLPILKGKESTLNRKALYWHFPTSMWARHPQGAIRMGDYKLIEDYDDGSLQLFNLKDDIGETVNLVDKQPAVAQKLYQNFADWRKAMDAPMPTINPEYDPLQEKKLGHQKWWK